MMETNEHNWTEVPKPDPGKLMEDFWSNISELDRKVKAARSPAPVADSHVKTDYASLEVKALAQAGFGSDWMVPTSHASPPRMITGRRAGKSLTFGSIYGSGDEIQSKLGGKEWRCSRCGFIHRSEEQPAPTPWTYDVVMDAEEGGVFSLRMSKARYSFMPVFQVDLSFPSCDDAMVAGVMAA